MKQISTHDLTQVSGGSFAEHCLITMGGECVLKATGGWISEMPGMPTLNLSPLSQERVSQIVAVAALFQSAKLVYDLYQKNNTVSTQA